jgi:hypothetical protein
MLNIQIAMVHVQCARISKKIVGNYDLGPMNESDILICTEVPVINKSHAYYNYPWQACLYIHT